MSARSLFKLVLGDSFKQILLPVESLQVELVQVLLHHIFAVGFAEMNLLDLLHDEVVADFLQANDLVDKIVASGVVLLRILVYVDFIWDGGAVDEDAALLSEDKALEEDFPLVVARNLVGLNLFNHDHVAIDYWSDESHVLD